MGRDAVTVDDIVQLTTQRTEFLLEKTIPPLAVVKVINAVGYPD